MNIRGDFMNKLDAALDDIRNQIIKDPKNKAYTNQNLMPIYQVNSRSKILIVGQAPGLKAQMSNTTWHDKSGDLLRLWLGVTCEQFYNVDLFGLIPMDFYFPGKGKTGDLPPRKGFAEKWHPLILSKLKNVKLIILIGAYSQKFYLKKEMKKTLTETVKAYPTYLPTYFPLSHPSPLNFRWRNKNPWYEEKTIPALQRIIKNLIEAKQ